MEEGKYEVVAGERRWRACALLGKTSIPALVRRKDRDRAAAEALIDNVVRKDLSAPEEAKAYQAPDRTVGFQQSELAERLGCHKSRISKALSILKLPETILNVFFGPESHMTAAPRRGITPSGHDEPRLHAIARRASKNRGLEIASDRKSIANQELMKAPKPCGSWSVGGVETVGSC